MDKPAFAVDDYIRSLDKTYWALHLSNGQVIYQDDFRYEKDDRAIVRAKHYIEHNHLRIEKISATFRSNHIVIFDEIPETDFVYFVNGATADYGMDNTYPIVRYSYKFGYWDENEQKIFFKAVKVPELLLTQEGYREYLEDDKGITICQQHETSRI